MDRIFEQRAETVAQKLEKQSIDASLKVDASKKLQEIRADQRHVLTQDGRETFVLQYLKRETTRFKAGDETLRALGADEPRTRPLCTCRDSGCALKDGRLPASFDDEKTLQRNIREFRHSHYGEPVVLDDAEAALDEKVERVMSVYDIVLIALSNRQPIAEVEAMYDGEGDDTTDGETDPEADTDEAAAEAAGG